MNITILGSGTSQGIPLIGCRCDVCLSNNLLDKRLRSSVFIQSDDVHFVIDSGTDFRQQILRENIERLDAIVYTHQHKDHTGGLDDVRGFNYAQQKPMPLYGSKEVLEQIKNDFSYAFATHTHPGLPQLELHPISNNPFKINNTTITPIEGLHHKLPIFGYRIHDFAYLTDMKFIPNTELQKLNHLEVLVINALQKEQHISHFNLEEALSIIDRLKPKQAFITHIGHRMGLHQETNLILPDHVSLTYDGLKISVE